MINISRRFALALRFPLSILLSTSWVGLLFVAPIVGAAQTTPSVTGVFPSSGPATGAVPVLIQGMNFSGGAVVKFGSTPATGVSVISPTLITAVLPAGTPSVVDVTVQTAAGGSTTAPSDQFTYLATQTYLVTTLVDDAPGTSPSVPTGTGANCIAGATTNAPPNNRCSLRDAIAAANALNGSSMGVITFASSLFPAATATNPAVYQLANFEGYPRQLAMTGSMTIAGPVDASGNSLLAIDGGNLVNPNSGTQLLSNIAASGTNTVTIENLILQNGYNTVSHGGGFSNSSGNIMFGNVLFTGNVGAAGGGGGINVSGGSVSLLNSTISANAGGGLFSSGGIARLVNSTVSSNTNTNNGGGLEVESGGTVATFNTTISGNSATVVAGGVFVNTGGTLSMISTTISANTAPSNFGGYYILGSLTKQKTLVGGDCCNSEAVAIGTVTDGGGNILVDTPMLEVLGDYGGPTQTMPPLPGSPAICAVTTTGNQSFTDQRGLTHSTNYCAASQMDAGAVQTNYGLSFTAEPPASTPLQTAMSPAPGVTVTEAGLPISGGSASVSVTDTASDLTTTPQSANTTDGIAAFENLAFTAPVPSDNLVATLGLASGVSLTTQSDSFAVNEPYPAISASFANTPNPLPLHSTTAFAVLMTNTSSTTISGFSVTATLPPGLTIIPNSVGQSCNGAVTYSTTTGVVTVSGFSLAAAASCTLSGSVQATATGKQTMQVSATSGAFTGDNTSASIPVVAVISPGASSLTATTSPGVAGSTIILAASVIDNTGAPVVGATVTFSAGASATAVLSSATATTGSNGVASVTLTDTAVETVNLSATISGPFITGATLTNSLQLVAPAFVVTTATDPASGSGTPANCVDPNLNSPSSNIDCSLRDAVAAADALTGVTTSISFATPLFSAAQTIQVGQSTPITMSANMNIIGPGANLLRIQGGTTPNSSNNHQLFLMTGGNSSITGMTLSNGYSSGPGGAIDMTSGTLSVSQVMFTGNSSTQGNAISASGPLTLSGDTFLSNNQAYPNIPLGGAVYTAALAAPLTVLNSTFAGDGGYEGGAIFAGSALTVNNSTFSANSVSNLGGAIFASASLASANNIFVNNSASSNGGAVYSTQSSNLVNSVLYNNTAPGGVCTNCTFTDQITGDPLLSPAGYFGGNTQTLLPQPGSSAICAGTAPAANTDQRGVFISATRYGQTGCYDVGAVQTQYGIAFTNQPPSSGATVGNAMSPAPAVTIVENGSAFTATAVNVSMTDSAADLTMTPQSAATTGGVAAFNNLIFREAASTDTLLATFPVTSSINLSAQSNSFGVFAVVDTLTSTKAGGATSAPFGGTSTYQVQVGNSQSTALAGIALTITLPTGLQVVDGSLTSNCTLGTSTYSSASSTISISGISLAGNATCSASVSLTATALGPQTVTAASNMNGLPEAATTAAITITKATPIITWNPASLVVPNGSAIGASILNATSNAPGKIFYSATLLATGATSSVSSTTILASGAYSLQARFLPSNSSEYTSVSQTITLRVIGNDIFLAGAGNVSALYNTGGVLSAATPGGGIGAAVDANGYVWSLDSNGSSLAQFTNLGALNADYAVAGLSGATALAIDGNNNLWVANGNGTLVIVSTNGTAVAKVSGSTGVAPSGISIDNSGNVWIANPTNNTLDEIIGGAAPVAPLANAMQNNTLGAKP